MSIRLIAADMDGTLLDSRKQLPEGLFPLVRALHERGVRFAPASGRQFYTLYEQFGEIADELMYISENGAMICDGAECVDLMRTGVSKGGALEELCGTLGITTADCMAFGDYLNDIELLRTAGESYAMANAHEQLAALAKYRCPSNDEDGVCRTIRAVFDL